MLYNTIFEIVLPSTNFRPDVASNEKNCKCPNILGSKKSILQKKSYDL